MKSIIIAFATYSKLPMPRVEWDKKSMAYSMVFFPWVGVVLGLMQLALFWGMQKLGLSNWVQSILLTVLPIAITGGIHLDGYMDTLDAKCSYQSRERKLEILKDPHMGAFAGIGLAVYLLLMLAGYGLVLEQCKTWWSMVPLAILFPLERCLSGLSVIYFPKAKKEGMLADTSEASAKGSAGLILMQMLLCAAFLLWKWPLPGIGILAAAGGCFLYYRCMSRRIFGGITGDLAGYFLQLCELLCIWIFALLLRI